MQRDHTLREAGGSFECVDCWQVRETEDAFEEFACTGSIDCAHPGFRQVQAGPPGLYECVRCGTKTNRP